MREIEKKEQLRKRKWYACDPALNTECRKRSCFLHGGNCELTSRPECAVKDPEGKPVEVNVRERLKEKMHSIK